MSFPHTSELGLDPISDRLERTAHEEARPIPGIVVYRFEVPLAYANAQAFSDGDRSLVEVADPPARVLVVDCELMYDVDYTGTEALEGLVEEMREVGVEVRLARVHASALGRLRTGGVPATVGDDRLFGRVEDAVAG